MKTIIVMGNGPSLRNIDLDVLKQYDTFGLNVAYRIYEDKNFYPTYFGSFDCNMNVTHKNQFSNLIRNNNSIQKFFLVGDYQLKQSIYDYDILNNDKFVKINFNLQNKSLSKSFDEFNNLGSSGANAVQAAILMGYDNIILLGCDCNYYNTEGMKINGPKQYIIKKTIDNPNSWFDEYHIPGDVSWTPKRDACQIPSWNNLYNVIPNNVKVVNCSEISTIPFFSIRNFYEYLNEINKE